MKFKPATGRFVRCGLAPLILTAMMRTHKIGEPALADWNLPCRQPH
jgi:hypothetical protein